jgi:tetratricopeptide (TPR) repeat protein
MTAPQLRRIIGVLLLLVKPAAADAWSEAQSAAGVGDYASAVSILTRAVDTGEVRADNVVRFETQVFLWRRELGESWEALDRLLGLPARVPGGLDAAALALGDYFAQNPADLQRWFGAVERHAAWGDVSDTLARRLLERNAPETAARVAGSQPTRCRSVLNDLARQPELAGLALASYGGDPYGFDLGTWRVWLRLIESARGPEAAVAEALRRVERDPDRVEFRCEASERLRGLGRAGEALGLWEGQDGSRDDRVYVERGECLYALGRVDEARSSWLAKLDRPNLRSGDVRTVARIFSDHGLNEEALDLLENPPTGELRDYARDIARLLATLGRYREAAETCAEVLSSEGPDSWGVEFFKTLGETRETALVALDTLEGREEPVFGRIRLILALSPWALETVEDGPGPLPHPWREERSSPVLDVRARRIVEDEIRRLTATLADNTDAARWLSGVGGLLPLEVVNALGQAGLPEMALESALRLASAEGLTADARGALASAGLSIACAFGLDARDVEPDEILALSPDDRGLRWRTALFLLRGGRPAEAEALLDRLTGGHGYGPDEEELLAARIEAALRLDEPERAWGLTGRTPDDFAAPTEPELHYQLTLLQLTHLAEGLGGDPSFDPAPVVDWVRRYIARNGDDPRSTDLLRLVLASGFAESSGEKGALADLVAAYLAGVRGDSAAEERRLRAALAAGGPLGDEAAVQLADLLADEGDYAAARDVLADVIAAGAEGTGDRALALAAWLDANFLGKTGGAVADLTSLIGDYPGSVLLEYARRGLAALQ